ncbi:MAG: hypothetical protein GIW97_02300, partial [Candidatus Eremiobacteraeota bacterium]|nr:hypothetical protein [Candidatus Eremiobacteraeota bacterium]
MKLLTPSVLAAAGFCLAAAASAVAATVSGNMEHPGVVWISQSAPAKAGEFDMRNRDRQFIPELLIVHAGDSVRFPNDDPYYHSIYSVTPQDPFDIGYYGTGPGKVVPFGTFGAIEVRCHINPSMHGTIVVADGPATSG